MRIFRSSSKKCTTFATRDSRVGNAACIAKADRMPPGPTAAAILSAAVLILCAPAAQSNAGAPSAPLHPALARALAPEAQQELKAHLIATDYLDCHHPEVQRLAQRLAADHPEDPRALAVATHDFVRDKIAFGWTGEFSAMRASEVLAAGRGYCNTKATLLIALLRANGIPARQHFVSLKDDILYGFLERPAGYVDHSWTEVLLADGRWIATDSYIVDPALFRKAQARLEREGRRLGYGVHVAGSMQWDGRSDSFAQAYNDGSVPELIRADFGVHRDTQAFYASGLGTDDLSWFTRMMFRAFLADGINGKVAATRAD